MSTITKRLLAKIGSEQTVEEFRKERQERLDAQQEARAAVVRALKPVEYVEDDSAAGSAFWSAMANLERKHGVTLCYSDLGMWLEKADE